MPPNFFHPLNFHLFPSTYTSRTHSLYTLYTPPSLSRSACLQLAGIDLSSINSN